MMRWIQEVFLAAGLSMRILLKGKRTCLILAGSMLLLTVMLVSMDSVKEEKSRIAVGLVDKEESELSAEVISAIKQKELYEVVTGEEKELIEQLKMGELSAVCVLKETFSEDIFRGKTDKLVTIYETETRSALLLGDILAGTMMQEICTAKGYQMLLSYEEKAGKEPTMSLEEYRTFVGEVFAEGGAEFSFVVEYVTGAGAKTEKPSQKVIYEQAVFAVFALMAGLIAIYAVLPFRNLIHGTVGERVKTLPVHGSALYAGSAAAGLFLPMIFGALFLICLSVQNRLEFSQIISLLICTGAYVCVIVCMMLVAAVAIKNSAVYQMGMLAMILIFGVFGLVSLVDGLLVPEGTAVWVPNGWYVRRMTELF